MKNLLPILAILLVVSACAKKEGSELEKNKKELTELKQQQQENAAKIKELETKIAAAEPNKATELKVKTVTLAKLEPSTFRHYVEVQGVVDADKNIQVNAKSAGVVTKVYVKEGDIVKPGSKLAQLDISVLLQNAEELRTQLDLATTLYNKQKSLWDQKIGSEVQFLNAKANKESMERRMNTLNSQIALNTVTSPIAGTVDEVKVKEGEAASPGFGLFRVVNLSSIKVKADIADTYINSVKKGDKVNITIPDLREDFSGSITFLGQSVDPVSRTFATEVQIHEGASKLRPNMIAVVKINDNVKPNSLVIDENLVQNTEAGTSVLVAETRDGKKVAKSVKVELGQAYGGKVEVLKGLKAGDELITFGYQDLSDGVPVETK